MNAKEDTTHLSHCNLDVAFDDDGWLVTTLMARLSGQVVGVEGLLNRCGWQVEPVCDISLPHQYVLMLRQGV